MSSEPTTHVYGGRDRQDDQKPPMQGLRGEQSAEGVQGKRTVSAGIEVEERSGTAAAENGASEHNLSTDHQPKGSAHNLSDTLDRENEEVPGGQRQLADDSRTKPND
jgi:hypothetical protein